MADKIVAVLGIVTSLITILTLVLGYTRNLKKIKEGIKAELRSDIEKYYYANLDKKELREYERKNLDSLYQAYHDGLHGNSFASDIYDEMREWRIVR